MRHARDLYRMCCIKLSRFVFNYVRVVQTDDFWLIDVSAVNFACHTVTVSKGFGFSYLCHFSFNDPVRKLPNILWLEVKTRTRSGLNCRREDQKHRDAIANACHIKALKKLPQQSREIESWTSCARGFLWCKLKAQLLSPS